MHKKKKNSLTRTLWQGLVGISVLFESVLFSSLEYLLSFECRLLVSLLLLLLLLFLFLFFFSVQRLPFVVHISLIWKYATVFLFYVFRCIPLCVYFIHSSFLPSFLSCFFPCNICLPFFMSWTWYRTINISLYTCCCERHSIRSLLYLCWWWWDRVTIKGETLICRAIGKVIYCIRLLHIVRLSGNRFSSFPYHNVCLLLFLSFPEKEMTNWERGLVQACIDNVRQLHCTALRHYGATYCKTVINQWLSQFTERQIISIRCVI